MTEEEVRKLAELARIELTDDEVRVLLSDFESILEYVSRVKEAAGKEDTHTLSTLRNSMREDTDPHESGKYSRELIAQFPESEKDYLKVKRILSQNS